MEKSRLKLIPLDVQGEILSKLNPLEIWETCQIEDFNDICNDDYFWKRYSEKWKFKEMSPTWKKTVFIRVLQNILFDYSPDFNVYNGIVAENGLIKETELYHHGDRERIDYYRRRKYPIYVGKKIIDESYEFEYDERYTVYKSYSQYQQRINFAVPYQKVIIRYEYVMEEAPILAETKKGILEPLSSFPYIKITKAYEEVMIDSQIKGQPIIIYDLLLAARAFMLSSKSKLRYFRFKAEEADTLIMVVEIWGNPFNF